MVLILTVFVFSLLAAMTVTVHRMYFKVLDLTCQVKKLIKNMDNQVQLLTEKLTTVAENVENIAGDITSLRDTVKSLQDQIDNGETVDLTGVLTMADSLVNRTSELDLSVPAVEEPAPPDA